MSECPSGAVRIRHCPRAWAVGLGPPAAPGERLVEEVGQNNAVAC
eukprot:CAMPEP_0174282182 /NCGR_PEP_ID=MMETSP0809-20121228/2653_1 /TAXON_ID=73025 ORGANISM="Eutreptiella gymnastica-like, Strain CCMP1594" /NCGR_SAMPLE_ID=MMETSP0809 /ASSEMBLY_ACC=CAM_ASM_000658 /LENGTH=44 /DNA_ID= /DNA_START= /DNA_END= /DNA_ORIENTATION=